MVCSERPPQNGNTKFESSILVPVLNQWELTRACLRALAATTKGKATEVIVIDRASTDVTPEACPFLGRQLFGDAFHYCRCADAVPFGGVFNMGATMARGDFLVFLPHNTVPMAGWYQPLIDDFTAYPDIAATGPLLVYPESGPLGHTVKHLGLVVSPLHKIEHLYEGIPADSPLAQKRRFFQAISGACMVIHRTLFIEAGYFDEAFISDINGFNGLEDVDLCLRLRQKGYRMTVNPEARVMHNTGRVHGNSQHEEANARHFARKCREMLVPDWHIHLKNDGMSLSLGAWQTVQGTLPPEESRRLASIARTSSHTELKELLVQNPCWEEGWERLLAACSEQAGCTALEATLYRLWPGADKALRFYASAVAAGDADRAIHWLGCAASFCKSFEEYRILAQESRTRCADMADQYLEWLAHAERFNTEQLQPFFANFWRILVTGRVPLPPSAAWAYVAWRHNVELPRRAAKAAAISSADRNVAFSILMPVYDSRAEHLIAALDSVLAQDYPHWELCIADDASTNAEVTTILTRYMNRDARIRVVRRQENGHIAAATNTALEMARHPWVALLDQDDVLTPDALCLVVEAMKKHPDGLLFYSDEDKMDDSGRIFHPYFKNGRWDWDLLLAQNFVSHLGVYRTDRMRATGGFRDGFPGSQDHDLVLRYTAGVDAARLIHIPHVLYHWRTHTGSTSFSARSEAMNSTLRAVQDLLDKVSPGATACDLPGSSWGRVKYLLPEKIPSVSLICDMGTDLPLLKTQLAALNSKTAYGRYEILVLHSDACSRGDITNVRRIADRYDHVRLLALPAHFSQAQRLEESRHRVQGQILGFLSAGLVPLSESWLEELVTCLCRDNGNTAACGGKVICPDGTLSHSGYLVDADGRLKELFRGAPAHQGGWFGWNRLARTVDALDALCFFTHRETLETLGGFDTSLPESSIQDYCLRLGRTGLRTVWWPHALFMLPEEKRARATGKTELERAFQKRWEGKLQPFNPNIISDTHFSLKM